MSKDMKYNELKNYKVVCNIAADEYELNNHQSGASDDLLLDYEEDLKELFGPKDEVDNKKIEDYLKYKHEYILYIEPIK